MAPRIASILLLWIRRVETQFNKHGIYKRVSIVVVGAVLHRHIYISSSNLSESTPQKELWRLRHWGSWRIDNTHRVDYRRFKYANDGDTD
jgi:hypothetical protein